MRPGKHKPGVFNIQGALHALLHKSAQKRANIPKGAYTDLELYIPLVYTITKEEANDFNLKASLLG